MIALLVFALGHAGLLAHEATSDHLTEDVCELCSNFDRLAVSPAAPGAGIGELFAGMLVSSLALSLTAARTIRSHRPRAPPTL